mmetsp:Transcript_40243/g.51870  ORF Transcript_40243/g.51870 Transcript_40243/m.51870 type:complete len:92 (+) Transcript_40243:245-520(+)
MNLIHHTLFTFLAFIQRFLNPWTLHTYNFIFNHQLTNINRFARQLDMYCNESSSYPQPDVSFILICCTVSTTIWKLHFRGKLLQTDAETKA